MDNEFDDEWSFNYMQTFVAEDFQRSSMDIDTPGSDQTLAGSSATSNEQHSSTVCKMCILFVA